MKMPFAIKKFAFATLEAYVIIYLIGFLNTPLDRFVGGTFLDHK